MDNFFKDTPDFKFHLEHPIVQKVEVQNPPTLQFLNFYYLILYEKTCETRKNVQELLIFLS